MRKFLCIILALSNIIVFASCKEDADNTGTSNKTLFENPVKTEMSLYSEIQLELLDNINDAEVVWSSSNEQVFEVQDGMVFAKMQGEASISATYKGESQSINLKAIEPQQAPFIDETEMTLILGSEFSFDSYLYVNGFACDNADYIVTSANNSVVSVSGGNILKAEGMGECELTISANWRGISNIATTTITCRVNENEGIVPQKKNIALYNVDKAFRNQQFVNTMELDSTVYLNGNIENSANVVWESQDESIAIVSGNLVQASSVGKTQLTGTYTKANGDTIQTTINVNVDFASLNFNDDVLIGLNEKNNFIDGEYYFGENYNVGRIIVDGLDGEYAVTENMISGKSFEDVLSGEYTCQIYCAEEDIYCEATLILADHVIYDSEDFFNAAKYLTAYIAVANDIYDIGERTVNITPPGKSSYPKIGTLGDFSGTFNGMGHILDGFIINTSNGGIFECATGGAVFKNFALTNVKFSKTGQCSSPLFYKLKGVCFIENVYIEVNDFSTNVNSGGVVAFLYMGGLNIDNCIFVINGLTPGARNGAICGRSFRSSFVMKNTYVITQGDLCGTESSEYNTTWASVNEFSSSRYLSMEEFKADVANDILDFSMFNKYWNMNGDIPSFSK